MPHCSGKSEYRNPKSERNPKPEARASAVNSDFGLRPSFGFRVSVFGLALLSPLLLCAAPAPDTGTNRLELIPENQSWFSESLLWDKDITLRAGGGYKDNVLLSRSNPQGSPFFSSGLDLLVFRLPIDGLGFTFAVTGDDVRYGRVLNGVEGEDSFLATAQVEKHFAEQWRSGLEARYLYLDQVAQELVQTGGVTSVVAKGHTLGLRPFVRRDLGTNWWAQLELPLAQEWWQSPLDDQWKFGAEASLGRAYGYNSQVSLTLGGSHISHDGWLARNADGTEIPGTKLGLWQQSAELKWEHRWDAAQRWRSTTKLGFQYDQDNASGFFDYFRYAASQDVHYGTKNWELRGTAGVYYYDFPVQPAEIPAPLVDFPAEPVQPAAPGPKLNLTILACRGANKTRGHCAIKTRKVQRGVKCLLCRR